MKCCQRLCFNEAYLPGGNGMCWRCLNGFRAGSLMEFRPMWKQLEQREIERGLVPQAKLEAQMAADEQRIASAAWWRDAEKANG